jgi:hypothetical protein
MSDPITRPNPTPLDPINVDPDGSGEHPRMMMFNGGILILGLAALFFCLRELEALFVVSMVLILLLALANLWILAKWRKRPPEALAATSRPGSAGSTGGSYPSP